MGKKESIYPPGRIDVDPGIGVPFAQPTPKPPPPKNPKKEYSWWDAFWGTPDEETKADYKETMKRIAESRKLFSTDLGIYRKDEKNAVQYPFRSVPDILTDTEKEAIAKKWKYGEEMDRQKVFAGIREGVLAHEKGGDGVDYIFRQYPDGQGGLRRGVMPLGKLDARGQYIPVKNTEIDSPAGKSSWSFDLMNTDEGKKEAMFNRLDKAVKPKDLSGGFWDGLLQNPIGVAAAGIADVISGGQTYPSVTSAYKGYPGSDYEKYKGYGEMGNKMAGAIGVTLATGGLGAPAWLAGLAGSAPFVVDDIAQGSQGMITPLAAANKAVTDATVGALSMGIGSKVAQTGATNALGKYLGQSAFKQSARTLGQEVGTQLPLAAAQTLDYMTIEKNRAGLQDMPTTDYLKHLATTLGVVGTIVGISTLPRLRIPFKMNSEMSKMAGLTKGLAEATELDGVKIYNNISKYPDYGTDQIINRLYKDGIVPSSGNQMDDLTTQMALGNYIDNIKKSNGIIDSYNPNKGAKVYLQAEPDGGGGFKFKVESNYKPPTPVEAGVSSPEEEATLRIMQGDDGIVGVPTEDYTKLGSTMEEAAKLSGLGKGSKSAVEQLGTVTVKSELNPQGKTEIKWSDPASGQNVASAYETVTGQSSEGVPLSEMAFTITESASGKRVPNYMTNEDGSIEINNAKYLDILSGHSETPAPPPGSKERATITIAANAEAGAVLFPKVLRIITESMGLKPGTLSEVTTAYDAAAKIFGLGSKFEKGKEKFIEKIVGTTPVARVFHDLVEGLRKLEITPKTEDIPSFKPQGEEAVSGAVEQKPIAQEPVAQEPMTSEYDRQKAWQQKADEDAAIMDAVLWLKDQSRKNMEEAGMASEEVNPESVLRPPAEPPAIEEPTVEPIVEATKPKKVVKPKTKKEKLKDEEKDALARPNSVKANDLNPKSKQILQEIDDETTPLLDPDDAFDELVNERVARELEAMFPVREETTPAVKGKGKKGGAAAKKPHKDKYDIALGKGDSQKQYIIVQNLIEANKKEPIPGLAMTNNEPFKGQYKVSYTGEQPLGDLLSERGYSNDMRLWGNLVTDNMDKTVINVPARMINNTKAVLLGGEKSTAGFISNPGVRSDMALVAGGLIGEAVLPDDWKDDPGTQMALMAMIGAPILAKRGLFKSNLTGKFHSVPRELVDFSDLSRFTRGKSREALRGSIMTSPWYTRELPVRAQRFIDAGIDPAQATGMAHTELAKESWQIMADQHNLMIGVRDLLSMAAKEGPDGQYVFPIVRKSAWGELTGKKMTNEIEDLMSRWYKTVPINDRTYVYDALNYVRDKINKIKNDNTLSKEGTKEAVAQAQSNKAVIDLMMSAHKRYSELAPITYNDATRMLDRYIVLRNIINKKVIPYMNEAKLMSGAYLTKDEATAMYPRLLERKLETKEGMKEVKILQKQRGETPKGSEMRSQLNEKIADLSKRYNKAELDDLNFNIKWIYNALELLPQKGSEEAWWNLWAGAMKDKPYGVSMYEVDPAAVRNKNYRRVTSNPKFDEMKFFQTPRQRNQYIENLIRDRKLTPYIDETGAPKSYYWMADGKGGKFVVRFNDAVDMRNNPAAKFRAMRNQGAAELMSLLKSKASSPQAFQQSKDVFGKLKGEIDDGWRDRAEALGMGEDVISFVDDMFELLEKAVVKGSKGAEFADTYSTLISQINRTVKTSPINIVKSHGTNGWQPSSVKELTQGFELALDNIKNGIRSDFEQGAVGSGLQNAINFNMDRGIYNEMYDKFLMLRSQLYPKPMGTEKWIRMPFTDFEMSPARAVQFITGAATGMKLILSYTSYIKNRMAGGGVASVGGLKGMGYSTSSAGQDVAKASWGISKTAYGRRLGKLKSYRKFKETYPHELNQLIKDSQYGWAYSNPDMEAIFKKMLLFKAGELTPTEQIDWGILPKSLTDKAYIVQRIAEYKNRGEAIMAYAGQRMKEVPFEDLNGLRRAQGKPPLTREQYQDQILTEGMSFSYITQGKFDPVFRPKWEATLSQTPYAKNLLALWAPALRQTYNWGVGIERALFKLGPKHQRNFGQLISMLTVAQALGGIAAVPIIKDIYDSSVFISEQVNSDDFNTGSNLLEDNMVEGMKRDIKQALIKELGVSPEVVDAMNSVILKGIPSYLSDSNLSWDEGLGGYATPFVFSMFKDLAMGYESFNSGMRENLFGAMAKATMTFVTPIGLKRVVEAGMQSIMGREMDRDWNKIGGGFGFKDFLRYSLMGRRLEHTLHQDAKFVERNPMQSPEQKQDMWSKFVSLAGIKYNNEMSASKTKNLLKADPDLYKDIEGVYLAAKDVWEQDQNADAVSKGKDLISQWSKDNEMAIQAVAASDEGSYDAWLKGDKSYIPEARYQQMGVSDKSNKLNSYLVGAVEQYYKNGVIANAMDGYISQSDLGKKLGITKINYSYPKIVVNYKGKPLKLEDVPYEEQGYYYAIERLKSRIDRKNFANSYDNIIKIDEE